MRNRLFSRKTFIESQVVKVTKFLCSYAKPKLGRESLFRFRPGIGHASRPNSGLDTCGCYVVCIVLLALCVYNAADAAEPTPR
ncbi:MAG: hypothetical protein PVH19_10855, partial [Planctomycetia bacterium]